MIEFSDDTKVKRLIDDFPTILDSNNEKHILVFRRLIEKSMACGYWHGSIAAIS